MRWLLSLIIGILIAWVIVLSVQPKTSTFQRMMDLEKVDDALVGVGLAQYPETKSIMDSINHPVPFSYGPAPNLKVIQGSSPSPGPAPVPMSPAPAPAHFTSPTPSS